MCREVIGWADERGVLADALFAILCLAQILWRRAAFDEAAELLGSARAAEAACPQVRGRRSVDLLLGMVALARGDLVAGHDHLTVALRARMEHGFHGRACKALAAMAVRCAMGGDPATAARLFGAADANRSRLRCPPGFFASYWSQWQNTARAALGDERFDSVYAAGSQLSLEDAAAVALAVEHPDFPSGQERLLHRMALPATRDRGPTVVGPGGVGSGLAAAVPPGGRALPDGPGVPAAQQPGELLFRCALAGRLGRLHLLAHQRVVGGPIDRAEHSDRGVAQVRLGQPGQGEGVRRIGGRRVVHDDLLRRDVGGRPHLQAEGAGRVHHAPLPVARRR